MSSRIFNFPENKYKDEKKSGWYRYRNESNNEATLRVQDSNMNLTGAIRLNTSTRPATFQGYNGDEWVIFSPIEGEKGEKGDSFNNIIEIENLPGGKGNIFKKQTINLENYNDVIQFRTLSSGFTYINGEKLDTTFIKTNENTIDITSLPQPYEWNIGKNKISDMKSDPSGLQFKAYGDVSIWRVKSNTSVHKGQAVSISGNEEGHLVISPLKYEDDIINPFRKNVSFLGIALRDSESGDICPVCTKGITTAKISKAIPEHFITDNFVEFTGQPALVGKDGYLFLSKVKPSVPYIQAGKFLEEGECKTEWVLVNIGV